MKTQKGVIFIKIIPVGILFTLLMGFTCTEMILEPEAQVYSWWAKLPVTPIISFYVYNVTNFEDFLNRSKPNVDEIGPYVYREKWERKNIMFNENGTVSYYLEKHYYFSELFSAGSEDDVVVVPNINLLSATSQAKHSQKFLRLAMSSIIDVSGVQPFLVISVKELLWGYEDVWRRIEKISSNPNQEDMIWKFGLMMNKNGTLSDRVSIFTGDNDITKYGLIDTVNGRSHQNYWLTDQCNSLLASDGSLFPPNPKKITTLHVYNKDLCRTLPLVFEREIKRKDNVPSWRFSPPTNVFDSVEKNPDNQCYCPGGPPCTPSGLFNLLPCQPDSPKPTLMLSFPHFYLADDSLRNAFDGISPPDPEKHRYYIDVQPDKGFALSTKARLQINLAVAHVENVKQVATIPDIIFPLLWFEESINGLPEEITDLTC